MMTKIAIGFLSDRTNAKLNSTSNALLKASLTKPDLTNSGIDPATRFIEMEKTLQVMNVLPVVIANKIASEKKDDFLVFGREREYFTDLKNDAETFLGEFDLDPTDFLAEDAWIQMVIGCSEPQITITENDGVKFIHVEELTLSPAIKKIAASMRGNITTS